MPSRPQLAPPTTPVERTPEEWSELLTGWGEPGYRALQVFRWIHQRGVLEPEHMSDLPKLLRSRLAEAGVCPPLTVAQRLASQDGTHKLLLELADQRRIESVLIPRGSIAATDIYEPHDEGDQSAREPQARAAVPVTQCVSSQVGCAMGCASSTSARATAS